MPTPGKPFLVLSGEKKSHRTKAELLQREEGEKSLSSGIALIERPEVETDRVAHAEFKRINDLLSGIGKNDALYEPIINRYCEIQSECVELKRRRTRYESLINEIDNLFDEVLDDSSVEDKAVLIIKMSTELAKIAKAINDIDKLIQMKRKMLFDIEKENVFTIASALRSIPKKDDKKANPLLAALSGG